MNFVGEKMARNGRKTAFDAPPSIYSYLAFGSTFI
jgi:hypothetical protein